MSARLVIVFAFVVGIADPRVATAQLPFPREVKSDPPPAKKDAPAKEPKKEEKPVKLPPTAVTDSSILIGGQKVEYTATAGTMPAVDKTGKAKANIFYVAYTRKTDEKPSARRLTFCFNGGPGSASAYVHLGFFGPKRVLINDDGLGAPTPAKLVDNDTSILDVTDLVFIDPVSTGFSRAETTSEAALFYGLEEDTQSVGEFIRDYVAKNDRKDSPVFIAGESYGTTRAASLSSYLQQRGGIKLAGIVLISSVLDWQTLLFSGGNDLPYSVYLPTYTATAFFHGKLDKKWATDLHTAIKESQRYAEGPYLELLYKGNLLSDYERQTAARQLAMLTGLSEDVILKNDLRIEATRFRMELLRDQQVVIGRLDSRVSAKVPAKGPTVAKGENGDAKQGPPMKEGSGNVPPAKKGDNPTGRGFRGGDPSQALLSNVFSDAMKSYLPEGLSFKTDARYTLSAQVQPWSYGQAGTNRYANVAPRLRSALEKDKSLRVLVASGYCDLATPFAGTNYTFAHIGPRSLMDRVTMTYYDAGHMFYTHQPSRVRFHDDLVKFLTTPEKSR
jgi:carboxypeptidase C (cathepsin A)